MYVMCLYLETLAVGLHCGDLLEIQKEGAWRKTKSEQQQKKKKEERKLLP